MLGDAMVTPMVGTVQPDASKAFYQDVLGLKFLSEDQFAAIYEARNARLRVSRVPAVTPAPYAVLAFTVDNIEVVVDALSAKGVIFQRYAFFVQDARGIWTAPGGTKVAWFHDPDLNLLSVAQYAE
jgi:catechol 2,3-dioxygenase-like lactoylglutathione lyase family enzyme